MSFFDRFKKQKPTPKKSENPPAKPPEIKIPVVYKSQDGWKSELDPEIHVPIQTPKVEENGILLVPLREGLLNHFTVQELKELAAELGLEYVPSGGKGRTVRELLQLCQQHGKLQPMLTYCETVKPDIQWQETWEK